MKKEMSQILLDCAKKYSIQMDDEDHRSILLLLLRKLRHDVEVTRDQLLAISDFIQGAEWDQQIYDAMFQYVSDSGVLGEGSNLGSDHFSQLFSDATFLSALSLHSPKAALAIILVPALANIMGELNDQQLAELYTNIASRYPDLAIDIFNTHSNPFILRLRDAIQRGPDASKRLAKILSRGMEVNPGEWESHCEHTFAQKWLWNILSEGIPSEAFNILSESEHAITYALRSLVFPN